MSSDDIDSAQAGAGCCLALALVAVAGLVGLAVLRWWH